MIKDCYVEISFESKFGVISVTTKRFTSTEEACSYLRRVTREYSKLKSQGIVRSYNIQCVIIENEE